MDIKRISFIGSGNLATNLALAFYKKEVIINEIVSPTESHAKQLAELCNAQFSTNVSKINSNTDLIIIAVPDHAIQSVAAEINNVSIPVVHTSGSVDIEVLNNTNHFFGVFYSLQVFSKHSTIDFDQLPIGLEANSQDFYHTLQRLAILISDNVRGISSSQRRLIHLAAVFACNFTNMNYVIADKILKDSGISFDALVPLIEETARRTATANPATLQTGPARRNDRNVIHTHLKMLENFKDYQELYELYSKLIQKEYHEKL